MDYGLATVGDLTEIAELLRECALPVDDLDASKLEGFFVARERGGLVGVAGVERLGEHGLLRSLAVRAEHRGRGIGSRLCDDAEAAAARAGVRALYLLTTSAADFFAARGFARVDRAAVPASIQASAQFRELCPATASAMSKSLRAHAR
jgi:amino-acid N-acetyltransferase